MKHLTSVRNLCGITLAALTLAIPAASQAQTGYTLIDLGPGAGYAINARGQVAGYSYTTGGSQHAFRWTGIVGEDLGTLDSYGHVSCGYGINNSGQVTGYSDSLYSGQNAVRWTGTTPEPLGGSIGYAINNLGQVAGISGSRAIRWTGTTPNIRTEYLDGLGGPTSVGYGINDSGQIAGYANYRAVRWTGITAELLDQMTANGGGICGYGINASGQVTGYAGTGMASYHTVIWTGTTLADLNSASDYGFFAGYAINASDEVVGDNNTDPMYSRAYLYSGGRKIDLNILLPANSGWHLSYARGINDSGWITGSGTINGQQHAFLLTRPSTGESRIALAGVPDMTKINPAVPLGTFYYSLRTPGTTNELYGVTVTPTLTAGSAFGTFTLSGIPNGTYDIAVKGSKSLRVLIPNFVINGSASLPDVTLPTGDANDDNRVDVMDFGVLVNAYGSAVNDDGGFYDTACDFNYDGIVDGADFDLLAHYGSIGAR